MVTLAPSEVVILRALADEYAHPERRDTHPYGFGPYGRVADRCGVMASRAAQIEDDLGFRHPHRGDYAMMRERIEAILP